MNDDDDTRLRSGGKGGAPISVDRRGIRVRRNVSLTTVALGLALVVPLLVLLAFFVGVGLTVLL